MSAYRPGHCNIGGPQRRRRAVLAGVAFLAAAGYLAAVVAGLLPDPLLVGVFVPLAVGFEWLFQASSSFCVWLAVLGRYDFRGESGVAGAVQEPVNRRMDRVAAARLTLAAVVAAAVTTGVLVVLL